MRSEHLSSPMDNPAPNTPQYPKGRHLLAYAGLVFTILCWSGNTVLARWAVFDIKPMALSFYRWFIAMVIILPFAAPLIRKDWPVIRQNFLYLLFLSFFSVAVYNSVLYVGAQYTSATNIGLVIGVMPGMTILFAWVLNRELPRFNQSLGVSIAMAGMMVIILKGSISNLIALTFNPGDLLILVSISSWALYSVLLKKRPLVIHPVSLLSCLIVLGVICIFPFYLWELRVTTHFALNRATLLIFGYLAIFPSILSYIFWNHGVKVVGPARSAAFMYLLPLFTAIMAFVFLDESILPFHIVGGVIIFAGLYLTSRK